MGCVGSKEQVIVDPKAMIGPKKQGAKEGAVYSVNGDDKVNVLIIGAGAAGFGAAQEAIKQGLTTMILEARGRTGGRIDTQQMGAYKVDLGASWIHGVGPGCGDDQEWEGKANPIYTIAKESGIETVKTWNDEDEANNSYYWYKGNEKELDEDKVDKISELISSTIEAKKEEGADVQTNFDQALEDLDKGEGDDNLIFKALLNEIYSQNYAADSNELSLKHFDENDQFNGPEHIFPGGYHQIIEAISGGVDVVLNTPVKKIDYTGSTVVVTANNGQTYYADKVIVTVPLGVLKANSIQFVPPLKAKKTGAIQRLGMGTMDKLWIEFPEAFWEKDLDKDWINYISNQPGQFVQTLNVYKYLQVPILLFFNVGTAAKGFSTQSDAEVVAAAMKAVHTWYPDAPEPVNYKRSNWGRDPYAFGAWGFIKAGATPEDCESYREGESTGNKVFFAGEATTSMMIGTVHGAYITGIQAAKEAAEAIKEGGDAEDEREEEAE